MINIIYHSRNIICFSFQHISRFYLLFFSQRFKECYKTNGKVVEYGGLRITGSVSRIGRVSRVGRVSKVGRLGRVSNVGTVSRLGRISYVLLLQ